ncbi:coiled-coil domain-containing protein 55-domain containing protein [Blastocladiella britannica]|nr:coiled-coil domain-containing protein 55-domain containing protein [Blastocladiella britannica]
MASRPRPGSSRLAIGLNVRARGARAAFAEAADDDDNNQSRNGSNKRPPVSGTISRAAAARTEKVLEEALAEDASAFDYDGVYDAIKARDTAAAAARKGAAADSGPRYMHKILHSAELRKLDHLKAQTTKYRVEAERDKAEFGDSEKFVTGAYREKLAEIKRMEDEQEAKAAADAERQRGSTGMSAFYRDYLARSDAARAAPLDLTAVPTDPATPAAEDADDQTKSRTGVHTNASGEIVDKRELLSAGLNVSRKPRRPVPSSSSSDRGGSADATRSRHLGDDDSSDSAAARRGRPPDVVAMKRAAERDAEEARERDKAKFAKKTDATSAADARARYLARKAAKAASETTAEAKNP